MAFKLEKRDLSKYWPGWKSIEISDDGFYVSVLKHSNGEINIGNLQYPSDFYENQASIKDLEGLHKICGEAIKVSNCFENYWNRLS